MPTAGAPCAAIGELVRPVFRRLAGVGSGRRGLAAHLVASALGHVLPFVRRVVARRLAGARVARRGAIVLAHLDDAITLFLWRGLGVLRGCALGHPQGDDAGDGGLQQLEARGHGVSLNASGPSENARRPGAGTSVANRNCGTSGNDQDGTSTLPTRLP